jgi:hypothetical protein
MTNSQERAVQSFRRTVERELLLSEDYEVKRFDIEDCNSFVSVIFETGLKGDEHTLASVFGRERGHIFIGKKGGITYPISYQKDDKYVTKYKTYKHNIWAIICDQRIR